MSEVNQEPEVAVNNPGAESLIFKPAKVSWVVNSFLARQDNGSLKWFVYAVLAVFIGMLTWCSLSEKAIVIDTMGEIIAKSPPIPVSTNSQMTIRSIRIKNNQIVKKDDILLVSTRDLSEADQKKINDTIERLKKNIVLEKLKNCSSGCKDELKAISEEGFAWMPRLESNSDLFRSMAELNKYLKEFIAQSSLMAELPSTTANIRFEIKSTQRQMKEIKKRKAERILAVEYEQLRSKLMGLESQLKEKSLSSSASLDSARNLLEITLQGLPTALKSYLSDAVIRAPSDGTITFTDVKGEGQIVSPGQVLFYLNSEKSELGVRLKIQDSDISKVKKGMEARLDITSYPAAEYGVQGARITDIPEKINSNGTPNDNSFDVFAELDTQGVRYRGKIYPLRAGVSLRAKIIAKHERLLLYYLKRLLSIKDEYLGE